jgi:hypothetical protein
VLISGSCQRLAIGCAFSPSLLGAESSGQRERDPVVVQGGLGPYEYAVLRADSQTEMLNWLRDNRYFVPAGTDAAVGPYINPGAYFLALKLRAGRSTGDLTPVVVTYASDLPMIPLILTSVGAVPDMGILVWVLGEARAIPRNFHHVQLNDARLDWFTGSNYRALVTAAVGEAPDRHAFVTEYAGSSELLRGKVASDGRYGTEAALASLTDPVDFVQYLFTNRFPLETPGLGIPSSAQPPGRTLPPAGKVRLAEVMPMPDRLRAEGVNEDLFYEAIGRYVRYDRVDRPQVYASFPTRIDAPALARKVHQQFVQPMEELDAQATRLPYLTRLFTTLSPQDMTRDPVFGFSRSLPEVSNRHTAQSTFTCDSSSFVTEQGYETTRIDGSELSTLPAARVVEILHEEGPPTIVVDNAAPLSVLSPRPQGGCTVSVDPLGPGFLAVLWSLRRRRWATR